MPLRVRATDEMLKKLEAEGLSFDQQNGILYGIGQIMMVLGADKLTVENFPKFAMRLRVWQALHGAAGFINGKLTLLGDEWLESWIGTSINGMPETDASWNKRMFNDGVSDFTRKWRKGYDDGKRLSDVPEVQSESPAEELSDLPPMCETDYPDLGTAVQSTAAEHQPQDNEKST